MKLNDIEYEHFDAKKIPDMARNLDSIFKYNKDISKGAYLNWRMSHSSDRNQFNVMGKAFSSAAYNLLQQCLIDNSDKKADIWIFPILFDFLHGIELCLKAINVSLSTVLNKECNITEGGHDLRTLCGFVSNLIDEYSKITSANEALRMQEGIKVIKNFIKKVYAKTSDITFARYPVTQKKQGQFYTNPSDNEVVDLELLKEQMIYVYRILEDLYNTPELRIEMHEE